MYPDSSRKFFVRPLALLLTVLSLLLSPGISRAEAPAGWWKPEWTGRKKITINTAVIPDSSPLGSPVVLVRLAAGDYPVTAKEDGSDVRFLSGDNKTELPFHIDRWDGLMNDALVWVQVPDAKSGAATDIWMYYGNPAAERSGNPKTTYDENTTTVYHFAGNGGSPVDSSPAGVNAEGLSVPVASALIGGGSRFTGQNNITIPENPALGWTAGGALTLTVWVKPAVLTPEAVIFSRRDANGAFLLGLDNGSPYVSVTGPAGLQRTTAATPLVAGSWAHLAVTSLNGTITLYLNGESYATLPVALPGLGTPSSIGKDTLAGAPAGFAGELDELTIANVARTPAAIRFAAVNQGPTPDAAKLLAIGNEESSGGPPEHNVIMEHVELVVQISESLDIFGWIVIILCGILALVGWGVAVFKLVYLSKIGKASEVFLKQWKSLSTDITALDHADEESVKSMGGGSSGKQQRAMRESPLFHLYHLGSQEIQHRIDNANGNFDGLPERSITSIRALLDGGATRETQKLNSKLVFLTIGIAGGPYLGLFGTVIGVMITFAVIARSGEVDINSIAPGIAGALLATLAGLAVAIPALFAYSYLASRIKDAVLGMHVFIDEFIARIAEAYPSKD